MRTLLSLLIVAIVALAPPALHAAPADRPATRSLDDYRHFRTAAIDLLGRAPRRDEIAAFERPDFDFDRWLDEHLSGPAYVERLTRIYMDLLRLEPNVAFSMQLSQLQARPITGPDGKKIDVFFRQGQRRAPETIDGQFCFSQQEMNNPIAKPPPPKPGAPSAPSAPMTAMTSMTPPPPPPPRPFVPPVAKKLPQKLIDDRTVVVRPWWLYRDYRETHPAQRLSDQSKIVDPEYRPSPALLSTADGQPTVEIRVCREEAQGGDVGHVYASGRTKIPPQKPRKPGEPFVFTPFGPLDKAYATEHKGEEIACDTKTAFESSIECGCGRGLERCMPVGRDGTSFLFPRYMPLGPGLPLDEVPQPAARWYPYWWSREAVRYFGNVFGTDVDFREILTSRSTVVNGPLAQFYRVVQRGHCCGAEAQFGMTEETEPLFDPKNVPTDLMPHDVGDWRVVKDRGPNAAGILTTPIFLEKYATARARASAVYSAFLCKSFVADDLQLRPSSETNLMKRDGCKTCHATLEPMAAYFSRIETGDFVFLPKSKIPLVNPMCKRDAKGRMSGGFGCFSLYDPAFGDDKGSTLKSAYGSPEHADATPVGLAREITQMPEFGQCATSRVTASFLGRSLNADDETLVAELTKSFTTSGFKMRTLVRGILKSKAYRQSNNLSSTAWRGADRSSATPPVSAFHEGAAP